MNKSEGNTKVPCPTCQKVMKRKCLYFHQCYVAPSAEEETLAWLGDAQHTLDVRKFLIGIGYSPMVSHTYAASLLSSKHQSAYMRAFQYLTARELVSNEHHQAQRFEARYATDTDFVATYKARLLAHEGDVWKTTLLPGQLSMMGLDHPLPNETIFVDPGAPADGDLLQALLMSLRK